MTEYARVSRLPWQNKDGYSYGGEVILTIGNRAIMFGSSPSDLAFAERLSQAWNVAYPTELLPIAAPEDRTND